jgi:stage II sporulation protein D
VLRRVTFLSSLAALGAAGAASATLVAGPPASTAPTTAPTTTTAFAATVTVPSTTDVSHAPVTLVISGHGWGHGVGLAQWGAFGYAEHGWSSARILAHYYPGTTLEQRPSPTVRVLLVDGATTASLASSARWSVTDARGKKVALPAGELAVGAKPRLEKKRLRLPLTFAPGKAPISVEGKPYRGSVSVVETGGKLQVVNTLKVEQYVKGVVGLEMPDRWPAAALEAQAVAARTFAFARLAAGADPRTFDVYADQRSQVYGGIEAETPSVTGAVEATARRVLLYGGRPITAYYSSSSGGRTVSAAEAFGTPVPYLVSVADPYDTASPNHDWGPMLFDARRVARALKVTGGLVDLRAADGPSGHVTTVTAVGSEGEVVATGTAIRTLLGLRSTMFTLGWLSLDPPPPAIYGALTQLTGIARDTGPVALQAEQADGSWTTVASVKPDASGKFEVGVRPEAATEYRLAAGTAVAGFGSLTVEPVVDASVTAGAVSGTVRPPLPGAAVQLQRQRGTSWATVATAKLDSTGSFAVGTSVRPGSYRVRWAPGRGLAPGVSRLLAVP